MPAVLLLPAMEVSQPAPAAVGVLCNGIKRPGSDFLDGERIETYPAGLK
jgi:hypothetical protein